LHQPATATCRLSQPVGFSRSTLQRAVAESALQHVSFLSIQAATRDCRDRFDGPTRKPRITIAATLEWHHPLDTSQSKPVTVNPARYVLLPLANIITGYTVKAMQGKIQRGDWQEGKVWRRAPDGRIHIDLVGYERSVEGR
jgi:hypothetical protein